ncbi:IclR family transcriptional regulator [Halobacteria archaeon HArc-gm2]|nr:IclR family transcriptional regulator [Halobacteria archaeon HArc-gm2]
MTEDDARLVNAAATCFEVLEAVRELDGAGVSAIARHLGRSKSGVFKHVKTLAAGGYLVQQGHEYHVGLGTWALGTDTLERFPTENGENAVDSLAASVDRTVALVLYEAETAVVTYVNNAASTEGVGPARGDTQPLHATAAGKVILAYAGETVRERVLEGDLTSSTGEQVTDPDALRAELEAVRQRRTAVDREEYVEGVECVAAPIVRSPGDPVGAIVISGTTDDLDGTPIEEGTQGLLVSASRSVENAMGREAAAGVRD